MGDPAWQGGGGEGASDGGPLSAENVRWRHWAQLRGRGPRGRCCTRLAETLVTAAELAVFDVGNLARGPVESSRVESSRRGKIIC
ncbi:hypothetical protein HETIRDRAFT_163105 [Heterobasidion irregulare TC 32-1]|uniref:Uncharacterized protein n=1 Tax=Heterobasidion irregulare (strain TC 32-1) TaxID=747525 RepID=W4KE61_HETIT|nr:uncharacterized protein HETIRDRAFT_163105 [Heterobasidion irregulare TC 32-1]ETW83331.1 hypothetical protein HETIRDRAFT_163105 [Heterobasidion irregulare TC 32-1]